MTPTLALLLLASCHGGGGDTGGSAGAPDPWLELEAVPLDPFRELMAVSLPRAEAPTAMVSLPDVPLSFVLDAQAGDVWGLDARYRHDPDDHCVGVDLWPDLDDDESRHAFCAKGKVLVDRGSMRPGAAALALAVDRSSPGLWMLGTDGELTFSNADPLAGNPLDFLRPLHRGDAYLRDGPWWLAADGAGGTWLADGSSLSHLDAEAVSVASVELPGAPVSLVGADDGAWALTEQALLRWDGETLTEVAQLDGAGGRLAVIDGAVWAALPAAGVLRAPDGSEVSVEGLQGPLGGFDGRLWAAVEGGVALVQEGGEVTRFDTDPVVDLVVQETGELALLHDDETVAVYVDETALAGHPPVQATITTFLENPKPGSFEPGCAKPEDVGEVLDQARDNARLLTDLPAEIAISIIPEVTLRAADCGVTDELSQVWDRDRRTPGLFFYGDGGEDLSTDLLLRQWMLDQAAAHAAAGVPISFVAGASRLGDAGGDWVSALGALGLPQDNLVFGMSLLPEVPAQDPRAKEPWPWLASAPPSAWRPTSAGDPLTEDPAGPALMWPGSTLSLFTMGTCANLWLYECKQSGLGGDAVIDDDDLDVLALNLWRALATRTDAPSSWYFHLPALGKFDYTDGCTRQERRWEGEDCQAQRLQDFVFDVQARYVDAGLVQWWAPGGD